MGRRLLIAPLVVAVLWLAADARAAELIIRVVGIESVAGSVHYGIYDKPEKFPKEGSQAFEGRVPVTGSVALIRISNVPKGDYAVAVFHDENDNGEFDTGTFGVPLEDYGFSNDASVFFGPPSFEDAKITVPDDAPDTVVDITVTLR